jgi:hypothetical protein
MTNDEFLMTKEFLNDEARKFRATVGTSREIVIRIWIFFCHSKFVIGHFLRI